MFRNQCVQQTNYLMYQKVKLCLLFLSWFTIHIFPIYCKCDKVSITLVKQILYLLVTYKQWCVGVRAWGHMLGLNNPSGEVSGDAENWIGFRLIGHTHTSHCHWNNDHWHHCVMITHWHHCLMITDIIVWWSQSELRLWVDTWWCVSLCRPDLHNNAASHYHFTLNQSDDWFEVNINWVGLYYYDNSDGQRNVWGFSVKLIIHHCLVLTGRHRDTRVDQSEGGKSLDWPIRDWESV